MFLSAQHHFLLVAMPNSSLGNHTLDISHCTKDAVYHDFLPPLGGHMTLADQSEGSL